VQHLVVTHGTRHKNKGRVLRVVGVGCRASGFRVKSLGFRATKWSLVVPSSRTTEAASSGPVLLRCALLSIAYDG
jgi:hypothetical protein